MTRKIFSFIALVAFAIACAPSTKLVATYKNPDINDTQRAEKVMVLALAENLAIRQSFEQNIASRINTYGIEAVSSLKVLPQDMDVNKEQTSKLERMVVDKGFDHVMVVILLDEKEETRYVPGQSYYTPSYGWGYGWGGYYYGGYNRVSEPGYYKQTTTYFLESRLYKIGEQNAIWAAQTETTDPSSVSTFSNEIREIVVPKMMKEMGWDKKPKN